MINLNETEMDVNEDIGNFSMCFITDDVLCLHVILQANDAGIESSYMHNETDF